MKHRRSFHGRGSSAALNYAWSLPWHALQRRAAPNHEPLRQRSLA